MFTNKTATTLILGLSILVWLLNLLDVYFSSINIVSSFLIVCKHYTGGGYLVLFLLNITSEFVTRLGTGIACQINRATSKVNPLVAIQTPGVLNYIQIRSQPMVGHVFSPRSNSFLL